MESSFAGPNRGPSAGTHFTIGDYAGIKFYIKIYYLEMGKKFCEALLELIDANKTSFNSSLAELIAIYGDKKRDEAERYFILYLFSIKISDQGSEFGGDEVDEAEQDTCLFNESEPSATPTAPVEEEDLDAKSEGTQEKEKKEKGVQSKEKSEKRASSKKKVMPPGLSSAVASAKNLKPASKSKLTKSSSEQSSNLLSVAAHFKTARSILEHKPKVAAEITPRAPRSDDPKDLGAFSISHFGPRHSPSITDQMDNTSTGWHSMEDGKINFIIYL